MFPEFEDAVESGSHCGDSAPGSRREARVSPSQGSPDTKERGGTSAFRDDTAS